MFCTGYGRVSHYTAPSVFWKEIKYDNASAVNLSHLLAKVRRSTVVILTPPYISIGVMRALWNNRRTKKMIAPLTVICLAIGSFSNFTLLFHPHIPDTIKNYLLNILFRITHSTLCRHLTVVDWTTTTLLIADLTERDVHEFNELLKGLLFTSWCLLGIWC